MALGEQDAALSDEATRIQATHRSWVVMWSAWHRTFTAFSCFTPGPLVVDQPTSDALVSEMLRVELHYSPTRIDVLGGFPPFPADCADPTPRPAAVMGRVTQGNEKE